MLRETKHVRPYPSRGVIEDVCLREGPPDKYSFTPFTGKKDILEKQFSGSQRSTFRLDAFLEGASANNDFNPTRARRTISTGILSEKEDKASGIRLEDFIVNGVEDKAVEDYLIMLCVGYKTNNTSPKRQMRNDTTRVIRNYSDDGDDAVEEKMLLVQEQDSLSSLEYEEIMRELPYLIKSIWMYSKVYQANLFSFMFAYQDIVDRKNRDVTITDFRDYKTYLLKRNGELDRQFSHSDDNKYTIYPKVTKIFIYPGAHPTEFGLCTRFLKAIRKLGIDYHDEDPLTYNNEFVNSLVCTYIPSNEEYFRECKDVDVEIMVALKPENILSTSRMSMYTQPIEEKKANFDYADTTFFIGEELKMAASFGNPDYPCMFMDDIESTYEILENVMYLMNRDNGNDVRLEVPRQMCKFEQSGLLYVNKSLCLLPGKYFGRFGGRTDYKVALTRYGFVIAIEESFEAVYYLKPEEAKRILEEYIEYGKSEEAANWYCL